MMLLFYFGYSVSAGDCAWQHLFTPVHGRPAWVEAMAGVVTDVVTVTGVDLLITGERVRTSETNRYLPGDTSEGNQPASEPM